MLKKLLTLGVVLVVLSYFSVSKSAGSQNQGGGKPVKVILKVEAEGTLSQMTKELSPAELNQLRSSISSGIGKLPNHKLVSPNDKDDAVGLLVVAEKLQCGRETYFLLSSVVTLAEAKGIDLFMTHNVFAESNLDLASKAVVAQLATVEFRILTQKRKPNQ